MKDVYRRECGREADVSAKHFCYKAANVFGTFTIPYNNSNDFVTSNFDVMINSLLNVLSLQRDKENLPNEYSCQLLKLFCG